MNIHSSMKRVGYSALLISALNLVCFVCFYNLDSPLSRADEVMRVRATQGMIAHNSFLLPYVDDRPKFNKPPMMNWMCRLSVSLFGESVPTFRLPSALAGFFAFCFVAVITLRLSSSKIAAWIAVVAMAGCTTFLDTNGLRTAGPDSILVLLSVAVVWFGYGLCNEILEARAPLKKTRVPSFLVGLLFGLGILTKSVAIGITLPILGTYALIRRHQLRVPWRSAIALISGPLAFFLCGALVFPPLYYGYLLYSHPEAFSVFFTQEVMTRVTRGYHHRDDAAYYFKLLFRSRRMFAPELVVVSLLYAGLMAWRRLDRRFLLLLLWASLPIIAYSCVPSRLPWYVNPAIPPLAILIGISTVGAFNLILASQTIRQPVIRRGLASIWLFIAAGMILSTFPAVIHHVTEERQIPAAAAIQNIRASLGTTPKTFATTDIDFDRQEIPYVGFLKPELTSAVQALAEKPANDVGPQILMTSFNFLNKIPSLASWDGYSVLKPWKERRTIVVMLVRTSRSAPLPIGFKRFSQPLSGAELIKWLRARPDSGVSRRS